MTILVQDNFTRANTAGNTTISNAAGWGTSSDGNTWASAGGTPTWQIVSNQGKVTNTSVDTYALLSANTYADAEALVRVSTSVSSTANWQGVTLRFQNATNAYYAYMRGTHVTIGKSLSNVHTNVADTTFTQSSNTEYWIRFRAQGTTLSAKIWADGSGEPSTWTISGTDTSFASGQVGIFLSPDAVGTTAVYDSFSVNDTSPLAATCVGVGTLAGTLSLKTALATTLAGTGTLTGTITLPNTSYLTAVWVTRDMKATWQTRDGKVTWLTRDEQAAWKTRS